ncbi:MAG: class E sortase [Trebonia sp.]
MKDDASGATLDESPPPIEPPDDPPPGPPGGASDSSSGGRHHRRGGAGNAVRFVLRGLGQTLITAGAVVLLFVVYEVYVTNYFAAQKQASVHHVLEQRWANGNNVLALPKGKLASLDGQGIANLYIPRLGLDYAWTIVQGQGVPTEADLAKGPAHYAGTALPGQLGNFAVAGHRVGKGEPFLNLDKLRAGDAVVVETKAHWYVYRVKGSVHPQDVTRANSDGIPGRMVVAPTDGAVTLPVPDRPGVQPTEALMTMTTCTPKFTAEQRMIVFAALAKTLPHAGATKPAAILDLYKQVGH